MSRHDPYYTSMIQSPEWRRLRNLYLMDHPLCERCLKEYAIYTIADCVHHIQPVEDARSQTEQKQLMFNPNNLMALCTHCHHEIHNTKGYHTNAQVQERRKESVERSIEAFFGKK